MSPPSSYPPARHLLRDLRFCCRASGEASTVTAPVVPAVCDAHGAAGIGFLATLVDVYAARRATHESQPDFVATGDLALWLAQPVTAPLAVASGQVLRNGERQLLIEVLLHAADAGFAPVPPLLGRALVSFTRLPRREDNVLSYPVYDADNKVDFALPDSGVPHSLADYLGIRVIDAAQGCVEIDVREHNTNRLHALQGGALATLAEIAATRCLQANGATAMQACDIAIRYLALAKTGPIRTRATLLRRTATTACVQVDAFDTGASRRLAATAVLSFAPGSSTGSHAI